MYIFILEKNSFSQKLVVTLFFSLTHATCMALYHTVVLRYSTSATYRILCYASGQLVIYCEIYIFKRVFSLSCVFLPCIPSRFFQWLHADLRNIVPAQLFVWITAAHRTFLCSRFHLKTTAGKSQNINLSGDLVL